MMGPYKNLQVWKLSMDFVTILYKVTSKFPKEEVYGLTSQMRRAAVSIPSNIAEGYGRITNNDLVVFLHHALGSSNELDAQIQIAYNLQYITEQDYVELNRQNEVICKMLQSLIYKRTSASENKTTKP
ncbi:MAG: four helix bundle protein, partial [Bacteroidales bacterium]|nr:four helix bundle protein [Bacteroidales bacterium]